MVDVNEFYDYATGTFSYVVADKATGHCAVVDPVLNYQQASARISTESVDQIMAYIGTQQLQLKWILETHAHADHLSAADYLRLHLGGSIGIGENIRLVQDTFAKLFNKAELLAPDMRTFDRLFSDGERISLGQSEFEVIQTPGHTPACVSYKIDDSVFVGDTLFKPLAGTARADFPGGDAHLLYQSIQTILALPEGTWLYHCHDYPKGHDRPQYLSTVAEQLSSNIMVNQGISEPEFVAKRNARDKTLDVPALFYPALQLNINAGILPRYESNGIRYLKIPINQLDGANESDE